MSIESQALEFALNNGIGALFGILMWLQANNTIKSNTKALQQLKDAIDRLK